MSRSSFAVLIFCFLASFSNNANAAQGSTRTWKNHIGTARTAVKENDFENAEFHYQLAFEEADAAFKGTDLRFLQTGYEAGGLFVQLRKFEKGLDVYKRVLERLEKPKVGERNFAAMFLNKLGRTYLFANDLQKSEESFDRAYGLFKGRIDERNPHAAESLDGLASVAVSRKEYEKAVPLYEKALLYARIRRSYPYPSEFDTRPGASLESSIQNSLGILHLEQTNYNQARKWFEDALETLEKNFGKSHAELEPVLMNLARTYTQEKKYAEAEDTLIRLLLVAEKMQGGALAFANAGRFLGEVVFAQPNEKLDPLFQRLLGGSSKVPSPETFFQVVQHMVEFYGTRDWSRTIGLIDKAVAAQEEKFGRNNKEVPRFLNFAAELANRKGQAAEEEGFLIKLVEALKKTNGEESVSLAQPYKALAENYARVKATDKAGTYYDAQIRVLEKTFGPTDSRVGNPLDDKATFLESVGRKEESQQLRERANKIRADAVLQ